MSGALVHADEVPAEHHAPGASTRNLLATGRQALQLVRRLVDVRAGSDFGGTAGPGGELWFVIAGAGLLGPRGPAGAAGPDRGLSVTADRALRIPPGARYRAARGRPRLRCISTPSRCPRRRPHRPSAPVRNRPGAACDLADCEVETTGDRRFRVLFGPGRGCEIATQFVGEIPAGRAPEHSHPYDELVLVLSGAGVLHASLGDHAIRPARCAHLPPGQLPLPGEHRPGDTARAGRFSSRRQPSGQEQHSLIPRRGGQDQLARFRRAPLRSALCSRPATCWPSRCSSSALIVIPGPMCSS